MNAPSLIRSDNGAERCVYCGQAHIEDADAALLCAAPCLFGALKGWSGDGIISASTSGAPAVMARKKSATHTIARSPPPSRKPKAAMHSEDPKPGQKGQRPWTHDQLCERAVRWLRGSWKCDPAWKEPQSAFPGEVPDAYGLGPRGSTVIECKVSRSDFLADKAKRHRKNPAVGMGDHRIYLAPPGCIQEEDFGINADPRWGWLEVVNRRSVVWKRNPKPFRSNFERHEHRLLRSLMKRAMLSATPQ